jgi:predicted PurR-regulated permease PerM
VAALVGALYLAFLLFRPFFLIFAVTAAVAVMLAPAQRRLTRLLRGRSGAAAGLLVGLSGSVIVLPAVASATLLGQQALAFYAWVQPQLQPTALRVLFERTVPRYPWLRQLLGLREGELPALVSEALSRVASVTNEAAQRAATGLGSAFLELAVFLLILFFLLRDGHRLRAEFRQVSPFSDAQEGEILEHLERTVKGSLLALVVVPLVQGLLAFFGFLLFGVPSPHLWAVFVVLAAFVPLVGSPLGWGPAVAYLFLTDASVARWLGLLLYCLVVVSGSDNLVKPLILRGTAGIHPLLAFLAILGGVLTFGPLGFLVGPIVLSLLLSALRIYRLDVLRRLPERLPDAPF